MEYVVTALVVLAFAGFVVWRVKNSKKSTGGSGGGNGGGDNTNVK